MSDRDGDAADATGASDQVSRPTGKRAGRRSAASTTTSAMEVVESSGVESGAVATAVRGRSTSSHKAADKPGRQNPFKRLRRFLREVVAELRKVIWPNRKQMVTYTTVVLVFVIFMVSYIGLLDLAFIKGVSWLFG